MDAGRAVDSGKNPVVLIGATVRSAAQSAQRAGFQVTGLDLFGDVDTRAACHRHFELARQFDLPAILRACRGLPLIRVGGLQSHASLFRQLADASPNRQDADLAERLRDVGFLRQLADAAGVSFPATRKASSDAIPKAGLATGRWLRKQPASCGGLGIGWLCDDNQAIKGDVVQRWVAGRPHGATLISNGISARLLGVCRSLITSQSRCPFVYKGSLGPVPVTPEVSSRLQRLGDQIVAATGLRGLFNVDYVHDQSGTIWLLEINPRWSGSSELIERRLQDEQRCESLFALLVAAEDGKLPLDPPDESSNASVYLKRILFAREDLRWSQSRFNPQQGSGTSLHDIPREGTLIRRGQPLCTMISKIDCNAGDPMRRPRLLLRQLQS